MMCADAGLHPDQAQAYLTELAAAVRGRWARQPKAERVAN